MNFYLVFQIQIEIIHSYNIATVFDQDLVMCESDVYFETYRHVYSVLKSFTEETFPMKNYIIDVDVSYSSTFSQRFQSICNLEILSCPFLAAIKSLSKLYPSEGKNRVHVQTAHIRFKEYIDMAVCIGNEIQ